VGLLRPANYLPTPCGALAEPSDGCWIDTGGPEDDDDPLDEELGAGAGADELLGAGALDAAGAELADGAEDELDGADDGAELAGLGACAGAGAGLAAACVGFFGVTFRRAGDRGAGVVTGDTGVTTRVALRWLVPPDVSSTAAIATAAATAIAPPMTPSCLRPAPRHGAWRCCGSSSAATGTSPTSVPTAASSAVAPAGAHLCSTGGSS
jgi:hypothetical protein